MTGVMKYDTNPNNTLSDYHSYKRKSLPNYHKFRVGGWFTNPFEKYAQFKLDHETPIVVNMSSHHARPCPPSPPPGYTKITKEASSEPPNAAKTPRSLKEQPKTPQQNHPFGWYGSGIVWEAYHNIIRGSLIIWGIPENAIESTVSFFPSLQPMKKKYIYIYRICQCVFFGVCLFTWFSLLPKKQVNLGLVKIPAKKQGCIEPKIALSQVLKMTRLPYMFSALTLGKTNENTRNTLQGTITYPTLGKEKSSTQK